MIPTLLRNALEYNPFRVRQLLQVPLRRSQTASQTRHQLRRVQPRIGRYRLQQSRLKILRFRRWLSGLEQTQDVQLRHDHPVRNKTLKHLRLFVSCLQRCHVLLTSDSRNYRDVVLIAQQEHRDSAHISNRMLWHAQ